MNYTRPNDENHVDTPEDWLSGALIFARTIGMLLPQGHGIVVATVGDAKYLFPEDELIIVANLGNQIKILPLNEEERNPDEKYSEGDYIIFEEGEKSNDNE